MHILSSDVVYQRNEFGCIYVMRIEANVLKLQQHMLFCVYFSIEKSNTEKAANVKY